MKLFKKHINFQTVFDEYLLIRKIEVSKNTTRGDRGLSKVFINWLIANHLQNIAIWKIDQDIISSFFVYLATFKNLDKTTCQKYFITLRMVFKFAIKKNYISSIPFDLVVFPCKKEDKGAQVIPEEDCIRLLSIIEKKDFQLYVACMLEYYCFIRPGYELRLMKVRTIDLERGIIRIPAEIAKNRQEETVTIPIQLISILKRYGIETADKDFYVFGKKRVPGKTHYGINSLSYRFVQFRKMLGLPSRYKFYSMKHTGAMALHHAGCPMRNEMDQLRHKNLSASQHYLKKHGGLIDEKIKYNFPELKMGNLTIATQARKRTKHNFSVIEN